ncbi:MAG: glycoside hydrolase family 2 protein [Acidimicrobiia bacterium]
MAIAFDGVMAVPGCWDVLPEYSGRRGLAAYGIDLHCFDGAPHRVVFDGVQHWCRVMFDGVPAGEHRWGFTRFDVDVPFGSRRMVVLVDNRDDARRSLLHRDFYDWHHHGGIARSVALHRLGDTWIEALRVTTLALAPVPTLEFVVEVGSALGREFAHPAKLVVDGTVQLATTVTAGVTTWQLELPEAALWSPADPCLHLVEVRVGEDDWRERIGIRTVGTGGGQVTINGEAVRLLGVNRHDMHPDHGAGMPDDHRLADAQLVRELGANFLRGGHYPQDEGLLDLCDEMGICVWSEATSWQADARQLTDAGWLDDAEAHIGEMIAAARNHPSVILWGLLNEGASNDPACRPGYERLISRIRSVDASRPVTFAGNHTGDDVCVDLVDVVGINAYPGWYYGSIDDLGPELDRLVAAVDAAGFVDKPIIVSEIGAEAIPGWRDRAGERWSEDHQARLLETTIRHLFVERDRVCGLAIWVLADFRTPQVMPRVLIRPRAYNHKGLVDEYRRPKIAAEIVGRAYHDLAGS